MPHTFDSDITTNNATTDENIQDEVIQGEVLNYDSVEELRKRLPQICQYVRSIRCTLTLPENLKNSDAVFTPFLCSLTYNYREGLPNGPIYSGEHDCVNLEAVLQILRESGVQQDLIIHIIPSFETRPFVTPEALTLLEKANLFKD